MSNFIPAPAATPVQAPATVAAAPLLATIEDPDFHAELKAEASALRLSLIGTADLNVKTQLDALLGTVHALAVEQTVSAVTVDLQGLEFMNSSCLKGMVNWISAVQTSPAARQYRISFVPKAGSRWQRRSLYALSCVAAHLVTIQD